MAPDSEEASKQNIPGWTAKCRISSTEETSLSGGACRTMMTDPIKQMAQPIFPSIPRYSFRKYEPRTALEALLADFSSQRACEHTR